MGRYRLRRARWIAAHLNRVGLGQVVRQARLRADRVLPTSVRRAGSIRLAAKTVSQREYAQEMQAGRDSYMLSLISEVLGAGDEVADVGAYVGAITVTAARAVGITGHVHSFEPDPKTFSILRRTVNASKVADRVTLHNVALAANAGHGRLHQRNRDDSQNSLVQDLRGSGGIGVQLDSFDSVLAGRNVRLAKIDVEGAELEVLSGMSRWLASVSVGATLIVESNPNALAAAGASVDELVARVRAAGFTPQLIDEHRRMLSPVGLDVLRRRDANLFCTKTDRPGSPSSP